MINEIVKVPFRKLKYIHHISDIQIRNLIRHKEYREVFEGLYEKVKLQKNNAIAYIGGDIAHSKLDMSPELIDMLSKLFKNLADICPTIIIAGNHDCNLNNLSRMDCLSPIVNNLKHPNLHYLRKTGVYKCADTSLVVWDVWDKEKDYIKAKDVKGDTKVVLYHGTVDQARTDLGFKLPSKVKIDLFKGYDLGLLGDIHKRQFINKKETIGYCGSLVQQNHGEDIGKGYLLWDVPARKSTYVEIPNDYGYVTLDIDKGVLPDISNLPKKSRVRMRVRNTSAAEVKRLSTLVRQKYPKTQEITITRTDAFDSADRVRGHKINIGDITDMDYQYQLISEYLDNNFVVDEETLLKIKDINKDLNDNLPEEEVYRNINWKLKKFEFSNMFSYGENNVVDFTRLNGIIGMFAPNASGKSALLDALSFTMYDTCSRAFKADNVLNNKKDWFSAKINVEVNGQDYWIQRYGKKLKSGHVKVNVNFYTFDDNGEKISMNGDQRRTTNGNIRRILGNYDDFILTTLSSQINNTVFIDKTQKERKELLQQFMGIGIFDKLYTLAVDNMKDVRAILKSFRDNDYDTELVDIKQGKKDVKSKLVDVEEQLKQHTDKENVIDKEVKKLYRKLKPVDESVTDIDGMKSDKEKLMKIISGFDIESAEIKSKYENLSFKLNETKSKIESYKEQGIETQYAELEQLENNRQDTRIEIDKLQISVRSKLDKLEKLQDLEYDPDCNYCMNNIFVKDAIKTKKDLETDKVLADKYVNSIDGLDNKIKRLFHVKNHKEDFDKLIKELKEINISYNNNQSNMTIVDEKKKNVMSQIKHLQERISKYYEQEQDVIYNNEINKHIDDLVIEQTTFRNKIKKLNNEVKDFYASLQVLENKRRTIVRNIKKIEDLENENVAYQYYLDAIKRDGVPYELITKALPTIEGEVNNILSQLVEFQIIFEMDGKNINNYIVYDDDNIWPLEMSSGMERFISSLALRVGLMNVSNLPASNFLAIDEGWGTMDSENINSVYQLFQYLKTQFQFTLIVSHIDSMRDAVDTLLEIKKDKNFSSIAFA